MALSEKEIQERYQKLREKFAQNRNLGQGEYVEAFGDELLKSVGLKELPKGSAEKVSSAYEALLDLANQGNKAQERVNESERKGLEKLKSKADLNPQKYGEEYKAAQEDIKSRDFWYKYYDEARNELIESVAPYVSSTEATPDASRNLPTGYGAGYQTTPTIKSRKADTTEKINDVLRRTRENMLREKREINAWQQSENGRIETRNLEPTGNDKIPYPEYSTEDEIRDTARYGERRAAQNGPDSKSNDKLPYTSEQVKDWLDATLAKRNASQMPSSMAPATLGLYSPEADRLEKRQLLADEVRRLAEGKSQQTAQSLLEQGNEIGVNRDQLSNLYKQYRSELVSGPPKPKGVSQSTFEQEEEQARARSKASGAFGGEDWRGRSSANSVSTPNLDQYASDAFGARPMGSETRMITSPAGQMRLMARKAARAGVDIDQLVSANKGDVMAAFGELEASGLGARGIRSQEEVRARPELGAQMREAKASLLKQQAEEFRKAEAERTAKEEADRKEKERLAKEEEEKKEKERLAKEEEERKEKERLAAEKEGDITAQRGVGELANTNSRPSRDSSPRLANPNSRPTNPNRA